MVSEREALARVLYDAATVGVRRERPGSAVSFDAAAPYFRQCLLVQADAVLAAGWVRDGLVMGGDRG